MAKFIQTESRIEVTRSWEEGENGESLFNEYRLKTMKKLWKWIVVMALKHCEGNSLVAQWLRIHLPMQGTRVQSLVREDPACRRATKPVHHNY